VAAATILAVAAFAGGGFSALALQAGVNGGHDAGAASRTLLSALGALAGLVFGLVIVVQGVASAMIPPCAR
jgi:Mn2+/Fe2+ NRAMP family transporter